MALVCLNSRQDRFNERLNVDHFSEHELMNLTRKADSVLVQEHFFWAVAILPSTAICPWNLFCRNHLHVFI